MPTPKLRPTPHDVFAPVTVRLAAAIDHCLPDASPRARSYHHAILALAPTTSCAGLVLVGSGVNSSSFLSRFQRADLPAPKALLMGFRFCYVGYAFTHLEYRNPDVAAALGFSSPQALCRTIRQWYGQSSTEWRATWALTQAVRDVEETLLAPYRAIYRSFDPWVPTRTRAAVTPKTRRRVRLRRQP